MAGSPQMGSLIWPREARPPGHNSLAPRRTPGSALPRLTTSAVFFQALFLIPLQLKFSAPRAAQETGAKKSARPLAHACIGHSALAAADESNSGAGGKKGIKTSPMQDLKIYPLVNFPAPRQSGRAPLHPGGLAEASGHASDRKRR